MVGLLKTSASNEDSMVEYKYFSKLNILVWKRFQLEWIDPLGITCSKSILKGLQKLSNLFKFNQKDVRRALFTSELQ